MPSEGALRNIPAFSMALTRSRKGRIELHDGASGHLPCQPQPRQQQPEGSRERRVFLTSLKKGLPSVPLHSHRHPVRGHGLQSPRTSSLHPLSLLSRVTSDLHAKKGANSLAQAPLGLEQPRPPAEDKAELCHCSSTDIALCSNTV